MTDRQILAYADKHKLFFTPYRAPKVRTGQELLCAVAGLQVVRGEHGPMSWPRAAISGHPRLIVCGDLLQALRDEPEAAVALHWGVHQSTVARWRRQLGIRGTTRAGRMIHEASMRLRRAELPAVHVAPGAIAITALTPAERIRHGRASAGSLDWTEEHQVILATHTVAASAQLTGRTLAAVRRARSKYGLHGGRIPCECRFCGYCWSTTTDRLPNKCASPGCRKAGWQSPQPLLVAAERAQG